MGTEYLAVGFAVLFLIVTSVPLGRYMARVFMGERTVLDPIFLPIERLVLRVTGIDPGPEQGWKQPSIPLLVSNVVMWLVTFVIVSLQKFLPLNPDHIGNMEPTLAFNTISSFVTNTNLQHYSGETGLSYFSQMFEATFLPGHRGRTRLKRATAMTEPPRPTADALLARIKDRDRARLRIYVGAAPGVGKTYEMLREAHALRARGLDVVVGCVETYGRVETAAQLKDLEVIPRRKVDYRGVTMEEMDVGAVLARRPQVCVVDELAHTNVPGSRHAKRYEDVLDILASGIHVMTAVNIQHLETLNNAVARATGVRVRETIPDIFLDRADEVINVDVTVEELRTRLREGKIYGPEKVEQALANFFRKGNLSTLRELALRAVADEVAEKAASYRAREGLEPAFIPERVMVCMSSNALAPRVIRTGARIAGRLGSKWYAVYVETPCEQPNRIPQRDSDALQQNTRLAESLGATVVRVHADRTAEGLIAFARREGVTHVIFGQSARSRWELLWHGSTLDHFLRAIPDAAVQVVPLSDA